MAYSDDLQALSPDHHWKFDGNSLDAVGSLNGTDVSILHTGSPIAQDSTYSAKMDATSDDILLGASTDVEQELHRRAIGGFFMTEDIQQPLCVIYGETDATRSFQILIGFGNNIIFEVDDAAFTLQIYSDVALATDRVYRLEMVFESSTYGNEFRAYIDGVEQLNSSDRIPGGAFSASRAVGRWGDSLSRAIGGTVILLVAPVNAYFSHWASWSGADAVLTDTEIREILFEKGALADNTITNQTGLTALADTERDDAAVCIDVNVAGSVTLTADNVTFNDKASVHVRYLGTGTLTWINTNGSNATIGATPNGGTIVFQNPYTLTLSGLVANSEVRVYEHGTTTEIDGVEDEDTGEFSTTVAVASVDIRIITIGYEIVEIDDQAITNDTTIIVEQLVDRTYVL